MRNKSLDLNTRQTKDLLIDFRKSSHSPEPLVIHAKAVKQVETLMLRCEAKRQIDLVRNHTTLAEERAPHALKKVQLESLQHILDISEDRFQVIN